MNANRTRRIRRDRESGMTLAELMIAVLVLSVGLLGMAKLFTFATLNTALAVNQSQGVAEAQRLIETFKYIASTSGSGASDSRITSATYDTSTSNNPVFTGAISGFVSEDFKPSVWVFDNTGALVTGSYTVNPTMPTDPTTGVTYAAGSLKSPSSTSRLVYILMTPKVKDPRYNQAFALTAMVSNN